MLDEHVIVEILRGTGKYQPADPIDGHEDEPNRQDSTPRFDEFPDVRQELPCAAWIAWFCLWLWAIEESQG